MHRRSFLGGNLGAIFAWLFLPASAKTAAPPLPTVRFNEEGAMTNALALLEGVPFAKDKVSSGRDPRWWQTLAWRRERLVWVDEKDALCYHNDQLRLRWGEMLLVETIDKDYPRKETVECLSPDEEFLAVWKLHPTGKTFAKKVCRWGTNYFGKLPYVSELPM